MSKAATEQEEWQRRAFILGTYYSGELHHLYDLLGRIDPDGEESGHEKAIYTILAAGMVIGMEHSDVAKGLMDNAHPTPRQAIIDMAQRSVEVVQETMDIWDAKEDSDEEPMDVPQ